MLLAVGWHDTSHVKTGHRLACRSIPKYPSRNCNSRILQTASFRCFPLVFWFIKESESLKTFTEAAIDPQKKSFLASISSYTFANGVQYFLEKIFEINTDGRVREVFLIVKESESTTKVVLGIELTPNMTVWPTFGPPTFSAKVTEQTFSPGSKLQLWVKSGISTHTVVLSNQVSINKFGFQVALHSFSYRQSHALLVKIPSISYSVYKH